MTQELRAATFKRRRRPMTYPEAGRPTKPKPTARKKQRKRSAPRAATGTYAYEDAHVLKEGAKPKKRKAAKKR